MPASIRMAGRAEAKAELAESVSTGIVRRPALLPMLPTSINAG